MSVVPLDHVQLAMPAGREPEARAFYEEVLGIPEIPKPASLNERGGCWFVQGDLKITWASTRFPPGAQGASGFDRRRSEPAQGRAPQRWSPVPPDDELAGYHRIYVDDPFGNRIELMEPR